jgi:hypothetical protein
VTIAIRPSCGRETGEEQPLICPTAQGEIFSNEGWTAFLLSCLSGITATVHLIASRKQKVVNGF